MKIRNRCQRREAIEEQLQRIIAGRKTIIPRKSLRPCVDTLSLYVFFFLFEHMGIPL